MEKAHFQIVESNISLCMQSIPKNRVATEYQLELHGAENKHCLICHHETTNVTYHPINTKNLGGVEYQCQNPDCQATGFIPRLEKHLMTKAEKKKADKAHAEWMKANPDWRWF